MAETIFFQIAVINGALNIHHAAHLLWFR